MSGAAWEKQIHFQLSLYKKFYIFLDQTKYIECRDAAAVWVRHSAGLESVRIVPPGQFWLCSFSFYCSQQIWICYCGESRKMRGEKKVFNLQKVQRFRLNKHKTFSVPRNSLNWQNCSASQENYLACRDPGPALWPKGRAEIASGRVRQKWEEKWTRGRGLSTDQSRISVR